MFQPSKRAQKERAIAARRAFQLFPFAVMHPSLATVKRHAVSGIHIADVFLVKLAGLEICWHISQQP